MTNYLSSIFTELNLERNCPIIEKNIFAVLKILGIFKTFINIIAHEKIKL